MNKGFVVWFTGIPASGKTSLGEGLKVLLEDRGLNVELLDGDWVRTNIHINAGFSKMEREKHLLTVAWIARLLARNGVIVLCCFVSPHKSTREKVRGIVKGEVSFFEVYVKCSLEEAVRRDPKGLYDRAKRGIIKELTGFSAEYEPPTNPNITLNNDTEPLKDNVEKVNTFLKWILPPRKPASLFIGRYQPFHAGHKALIESVLGEGKPVVVAIRDTEMSDRDPYSVKERKHTIEWVLRKWGGMVEVIVIPDIGEVCYGRKVGWGVREIRLGVEVEAISATKIREGKP